MSDRCPPEGSIILTRERELLNACQFRMQNRARRCKPIIVNELRCAPFMPVKEDKEYLRLKGDRRVEIEIFGI